MMKASELRSKTRVELTLLMAELYREQFNLRMQRATGQMAKSSRVRQVRQSIARINTILTEKSDKV